MPCETRAVDGRSAIPRAEPHSRHASGPGESLTALPQRRGSVGCPAPPSTPGSYHVCVRRPGVRRVGWGWATGRARTREASQLHCGGAGTASPVADGASACPGHAAGVCQRGARVVDTAA